MARSMRPVACSAIPMLPYASARLGSSMMALSQAATQPAASPSWYAAAPTSSHASAHSGKDATACVHRGRHSIEHCARGSQPAGSHSCRKLSQAVASCRTAVASCRKLSQADTQPLLRVAMPQHTLGRRCTKMYSMQLVWANQLL